MLSRLPPAIGEEIRLGLVSVAVALLRATILNVGNGLLRGVYLCGRLDAVCHPPGANCVRWALAIVIVPQHPCFYFGSGALPTASECRTARDRVAAVIKS